MNVEKLNIPFVSAIVVASVALGWGVTWASMSGEVRELQKDVSEIKDAISEMRETAKVVTQLSVKIDMLTAAQEKTSQKVDDIRVMVRD